ncbi:unnamed protein product [Cunninghamella blakesleeana]
MLASQQPEFTPITPSTNMVNASHRPIKPTRKRTHLSAAQINSLQASFNTNPLPDAAIRHRLAITLGITERTVQIWFQNRRAKARKSDFGNKSMDGQSPLPHLQQQQHIHPSLSSLNPSSSTPRYQATFRSLMTPERFEELQSTSTSPSSSSHPLPTRRRPRSASKPEPKSLDLLTNNNAANRAMSEVIDRPLDTITNHPSVQSQLLTMNEDQSYFVTLPAQLLRIGTWTRFASNNNNDKAFDLLCTLNKKEVVYQIQAGGQQFRIQFPLTAIHQLSLNNNNNPELVGSSQLDLHVDPQQVNFFMCLQNGSEWVRCGDFSEEKQASQLFIHEIQGDHHLLQQVMVDMMTYLPDLASKFIVSPLLMDDFTVSPSATPEPFNMGMNHQPHALQQHPSNTFYHPQSFMMDKSMMLQAPFYYPTAMDPHHQQQLYLQQMMMM